MKNSKHEVLEALDGRSNLIETTLLEGRVGKPRWKILNTLFKKYPSTIAAFESTFKNFHYAYRTAHRQGVNRKIILLNSGHTPENDDCRRIANRFGLKHYYGVVLPEKVQSKFERTVSRIVADPVVLAMLIAAGFGVFKDQSYDSYTVDIRHITERLNYLSLGTVRTHIPRRVARDALSIVTEAKTPVEEPADEPC